MASDQFADGQFGYDVGQVPAQPVIVTNPDKGRIEDLKPSLREMVLDAPGNKAYRVDEEDTAVGVQYLGIDNSGGKEYTMPAARIATPQSSILCRGTRLTLREYNQYQTLCQLLFEADVFDPEWFELITDVVIETFGKPGQLADEYVRDELDM